MLSEPRTCAPSLRMACTRPWLRTHWKGRGRWSFPSLDQGGAVTVRRSRLYRENPNEIGCQGVHVFPAGRSPRHKRNTAARRLQANSSPPAPAPPFESPEQPLWQLPQHVLPRTAIHPSRAMIGTIAIAATGSAHHQPHPAFRISPARRITDKYKQKSVCLASASIAALRIRRATSRFPRASTGMTTTDIAAIKYRERSSPEPGNRRQPREA